MHVTAASISFGSPAAKTNDSCVWSAVLSCQYIDTSNDERTTVIVYAPVLGDAIMEKTYIVALSADVISKVTLVLIEIVDDEDVGIL